MEHKDQLNAPSARPRAELGEVLCHRKVAPNDTSLAAIEEAAELIHQDQEP